MSPKADPRKPKPNPELRDIERVIRNNWASFRSEKDHTRRRGYAMILGAALEQWLDEPEHSIDLVDGQASTPPGGHPDPGILDGAETLFEQPGPSSGQHFWLGSNYVPTTLFDAKGPDPHDPWKLSGFVVLRFEKLFATDETTGNHFTSEAAFRRHAGREPARPFSKGDVFVLCDPKGYFDGRTALPAARYRSLSTAKKRAMILASRFGIRFAVARLIGLLDTH